jgi:hypothetical protein
VRLDEAKGTVAKIEFTVPTGPFALDGKTTVRIQKPKGRKRRQV